MNNISLDYKPWVVLGAQSQLEAQTDVSRRCGGVECQPVLTYDIEWTGRDFIDAETSALKESLNIVVSLILRMMEACPGHIASSQFSQPNPQERHGDKCGAV